MAKRFFALAVLISCNGAFEFDTRCENCREDGESCSQSINCRAGSICNGDDVLEVPPNICVHVLCTGDHECDASERCTPARICEPRICQADADCPSDQVCGGGECTGRPPASAATACRVMTPSQPLTAGARLPLEVLVLDGEGRALQGVDVEWSDDALSLARVEEGNEAVAGAIEGRAVLRAKLRDAPQISCGALALEVLAPIAAHRVRATVIAEHTLAPIAGAEVIFHLRGSERAYFAETDARGVAEFSTRTPTVARAITAISVIAGGFISTSVLSPGANDLSIPLARAADPRRAAGFRGTVELLAQQSGDIAWALAGAARGMNVLDYTIEPGPVDLVDATLLSAATGREVPITAAGNFVHSFGSLKFTAAASRCFDLAIGPAEAGCFVVRATPGPTSLHVFGAELRISDNPAIFLSWSAGVDEVLDYRRGLIAFSQMVPRLLHGVQPIADLPSVPAGERKQYSPVRLIAENRLGLHSVVRTPDVPPKLEGGCPAHLMVGGFSVATGRGLVPLGWRLAPIASFEAGRSCRSRVTLQPFGEVSPMLPSGQVPLSLAPPSGGLEGSPQLLAAVAFDERISEDSPFRLNMIFTRTATIQDSTSFEGKYLPYPRGIFHRAEARYESLNADQLSVAGATAVRITIEGREAWNIYFPAGDLAAIAPNLPALRAIAAESERVTIRAFRDFRPNAPYSELWRLGSNRTLDRLVENITALAVEGAQLE